MPPGSLVIANVPLPPAVYRTLRAQAAASGQAPAQLMAAILSRGREIGPEELFAEQPVTHIVVIGGAP
jgi:hypothetical protein